MLRTLKIWIIGLILLTIAAACSGPERTTREQFYPDGKIKERWHEILINDSVWVKDGADTTFNQDGIHERAWNYRQGKKEGRQFGWYSDGQPRYEVHYKNDLREGKETLWFKDGKLRGESFYRKGELDGKSLAWFANGHVREEINYVLGNKEGIRLRYNRDGDTILHEIFKDNVRIEKIK